MPRADEHEYFAAFIINSICTLINALIIGYMTSYAEEMSKQTADLSDKLNFTNTAMINLNLSPDLKAQITQYIY